tara:strand:- start:101 stop:433 length:333 start_codon:yes stop_codon:yes gene_type:complete
VNVLIEKILPQPNIPEFWLSSEWKEKLFYILVPGKSGTVAEKEWSATFFSDLTTKVFQQTGWKGIICGTKQKHSLGEQILKQSDAHLQKLVRPENIGGIGGVVKSKSADN